jgi:rfaE bifunctional protein nucleotidyltransferase chain/domain
MESKNMGSNDKIRKIEELAELLALHGAENKKIVYCHGVFDILHIGHIRYLEQAKRMGNVLVVTVTPDRYVDKGPGRPVFNESLRAESIASLHFVDYVAINQWPTAVEAIRLLKPDFYVRGSDFKSRPLDISGNTAKEEDVVREVGAILAYTDDIHFSSSGLINRYLSNFPEEVQDYINVLRQRYNCDQILQAIEKMANLRVLVIGDTILDEYQKIRFLL